MSLSFIAINNRYSAWACVTDFSHIGIRRWLNDKPWTRNRKFVLIPSFYIKAGKCLFDDFEEKAEKYRAVVVQKMDR